jgi:hypothetical protein
VSRPVEVIADPGRVRRLRHHALGHGKDHRVAHERVARRRYLGQRAGLHERRRGDGLRRLSRLLARLGAGREQQQRPDHAGRGGKRANGDPQPDPRPLSGGGRDQLGLQLREAAHAPDSL